MARGVPPRPWLLGILLLGSLVAARFAIESWWIAALDDRLESEASDLAKDWSRAPSEPRWSRPDPFDELSDDFRQQGYWEFRDHGDRLLARSPLLARARFPSLPADRDRAGFWYHDLYHHKMRVVALRVAVANREVVAYFGQDYREHKERRQLLDRILLVVALLGTATLAALARTGRRTAPRRPVGLFVRLLAGSILASSLILSLAAWATYAAVRRGWVGQLDQSLESRARGVAALCARAPDGTWRFEGDLLEATSFQHPKSLEYFEVRDERGREIGRSSSLGHLSFPAESPKTGTLRFDWFHPTFLHKTRYVALSIPREGRWISVFFGQDYRGMKARLRELRNLLVGIWGLSEVLLIVLLALLARSATSPLRRLASRLETVDERHLAAFPADDVPLEVRPLADSLTRALARLDTAFERERVLVADLAHELRTPMAGIRTILEVGIDDDDVHARKAMSDALSVLGGMEWLADSLLALARVESGQSVSSLVEVDLAPAVRRLGEDWSTKALARGIALHVRVPESLSAKTDPDWVGAILRNLLENAFAHAPEASRIELEAERDGEQVRIAVTNDGARLDPEDIPRVFDRFWRKDPARQGSNLHAGLGLALSRELAVRMRGDLTAELPAPGTFRAELRLPAARESSSRLQVAAGEPQHP